MNNFFAIAIPVMPGKTEQVRKFTKTLMNEKNQEFKNSRKNLGIIERSFLQSTPHGDMIIVTLEGENAAEAFTKFGQGSDSFTQWFRQQVKEIHGVDLNAPPPGPMPELVADSGK